MAAAQTFQPQGSAPSSGVVGIVQSGDGAGGLTGTVAGSVQAVVVVPSAQPSAPQTIYIGADDGGIWKTINSGASWTPIGDKQASLSIASLWLDPTDATGRTLVAGTGLTGNGLYDRPPTNPAAADRRVGLLYTQDGGQTWSQLGKSMLSGISIVSVQARGTQIFAAASEPHNPAGTAGGLYVSNDRGVTFSLVGGGLSAGPVTAFVGAGTVQSPFFAAVSGVGVFASSDGGTSWSSKLSLTAGQIARLASGPAGSVAAAVFVGGNGTGQGSLTNLYLSQNMGQSWTRSSAVPPINPGQQANTNLAVAIDPANANIVYVAGDRLANPPFTVNAYRVVFNTGASTSSFQPLTDAGFAANSSTAHADARALAFDNLGQLLLGSDGGLYMRSDPTSIAGSWTGLNTSGLSLRMPYGIAYDSRSRLLVMAAQDTGVALQNAPGSASYRAIMGADGINSVFNDRSYADSILYSSVQGLGGLSRRIVNSAGLITFQRTFETEQNEPGVLNFEATDYTNPGESGGGKSLPFQSKIVLNRNDPTLIAFGTNYVYSTTDQSLLNSATPLLNLGVSGQLLGEVTSIAYGTADNPYALLAGTTGAGSPISRLYLSTANTARSLAPVVSYAGDTPTSVVFDYRTQNAFFAADGANLWGTSNRGGAFTNYKTQLNNVGVAGPTALEFINSNGVNSLLVGGVVSSVASQSPIAVVDSDLNNLPIATTWRPFGLGLPNSLVSVLSYNAAADALAVASYGRGGWLLYDVTSYFATAQTLQFGLAGNDSAPLASQLSDGNNGTTAFSRPLVKSGAGTVTIGVAASYSGGTTVNAGTLLLSGSGTLGSTGAATTVAGGTLDLGGTTQTQNGGVTLESGQILNGTLASSTGFTLQSGVINATLAGSGGLAKTTSGVVTLQGPQTFAGTTTISSGSLVVNGSIANSSAVTVAPAAILSGRGTVAASTINGLIAPGLAAGAPSTLTVNGSYAQTAASSYQVQANTGGSDLVKVNGPAALGGSVSAAVAPGNFGAGKTFTILSATGLSGRYAGATSNYSFLQTALSYDANNVYLSLAPGGFAQGAQSGNQRAVATALDASVAGATGDWANVLGALGQMTAGQAPAVFDQLSGQNYASFATVAVQGAQLFMTNFAQIAGGAQAGSGRIALAQACQTACDLEGAKWGAWGGGVGGLGTVASTADSHGTTYNIGGFAAGLDYRLAPQVLAGITLGYANSQQWTQGMDGRGWSDTVQVGLYGSFSPGAFYLDALAGYARSTNNMVRPITLPSLGSRTAQGQAPTDQFFGQLEAGWRIDLGGAPEGFVTPFARLQGTTATQAAFSEWGAGSVGLSVAAQTTNSVRSVFGGQVGGRIDAGWRDKLGLVVRLGWSHEYADTARPVNAAFVGAPASSFVVAGAAAPRDGAVLGFAANTNLGEATSLYARYDGEVAGGNTAHIFSAGLRLVW